MNKGEDVPISVQCDCGTMLKVRDDRVGKFIRCPACGKSMLTAKPQQEPTPTAQDAQESTYTAVKREARYASVPSVELTFLRLMLYLALIGSALSFLGISPRSEHSDQPFAGLAYCVCLAGLAASTRKSGW